MVSKKIKKVKRSPVEHRKEQITREIEKLEIQYVTKTRRKFKTDEGFENWQISQRQKIDELKEELDFLNDPGERNEVPLAIAAEELGLTLNEICFIEGDNLIQLSFQSYYAAGSRITRDELARLHELGAEELLRLSNQEEDEIFEEAIQYFHAGDLERAEMAYKRIDGRKSYTPLMYVFDLALELLRGEYESAVSSIKYICRKDDLGDTAILVNLGRVLKGMKMKDHGGEVLREQILAITEGKKLDPFGKWYYGHGRSQVGLKLHENQKHAMVLATAVTRALKKYKYSKQFKSIFGRPSDIREEEFEEIIKDAIYTVLQAESTYYESATSRLYVDKLVASLPTWWVPAEEITLLASKTDKEQREDSIETIEIENE